MRLCAEYAFLTRGAEFNAMAQGGLGLGDIWRALRLSNNRIHAKPNDKFSGKFSRALNRPVIYQVVQIGDGEFFIHADYRRRCIARIGK